MGYFAPISSLEGGRQAVFTNFLQFRKIYKAVETFNVIFENTLLQRLLGQNMKKFEISRLTPNSP